MSDLRCSHWTIAFAWNSHCQQVKESAHTIKPAHLMHLSSFPEEQREALEQFAKAEANRISAHLLCSSHPWLVQFGFSALFKEWFHVLLLLFLEIELWLEYLNWVAGSLCYLYLCSFLFFPFSGTCRMLLLIYTTWKLSNTNAVIGEVHMWSQLVWFQETSRGRHVRIPSPVVFDVLRVDFSPNVVRYKGY
jgi:hypothetical protein